ncbi:MAG TPA: DUF4149 domain-containing protein [Planctomycetota bacterium]|nr:DUF4149 domain-containing protein [Planctomycetota bacterium]
MLKFVRAIRGLSLAIWLGGSVMTFITAYYVFGVAGNDPARHNLAGDIMGPILHFGGVMKLVLATLALAAHGMLRGDGPDGRSTSAHKTTYITLALAALIACFVVLYIEPKLVELRPQFMNDSSKDNPAHQQFAMWHGVSMGITSLETLLIAVALVCVL